MRAEGSRALGTATHGKFVLIDNACDSAAGGRFQTPGGCKIRLLGSNAERVST